MASAHGRGLGRVPRTGLDLQSAVAHARKAIEKSRREDSHPLLWKLLLQLRTDESIAELIELARRASANDRLNKRTRSVAAATWLLRTSRRVISIQRKTCLTVSRMAFHDQSSSSLGTQLVSRSLTGTVISGNR